MIVNPSKLKKFLQSAQKWENREKKIEIFFSLEMTQMGHMGGT